MNRMFLFVCVSLMLVSVAAAQEVKKLPVIESTNIKVNPGALPPTKDGLVPMPLDAGESLLTIGIETQPNGAPLHTLKVVVGNKDKNGVTELRGTYKAGYDAGSMSTLSRHTGLVRGSITEDGRVQLILLRQRRDVATIWDVAPYAVPNQVDGGVIIFEGSMLDLKDDKEIKNLVWMKNPKRNTALEGVFQSFGQGRLAYEKAKAEADAAADKK